jgi:hypothetical protein
VRLRVALALSRRIEPLLPLSRAPCSTKRPRVQPIPIENGPASDVIHRRAVRSFSARDEAATSLCIEPEIDRNVIETDAVVTVGVEENEVAG